MRLLAEPPNGVDLDDVLETLLRLNPSALDKEQARYALLRMTPNAELADPQVVETFILLGLTEHEKLEYSKKLLRLLHDHREEVESFTNLVSALGQVGANDRDKQQALTVLEGLLVDPPENLDFLDLMNALSQLEQTEQGRQQAWQALVRLADQPGWHDNLDRALFHFAETEPNRHTALARLLTLTRYFGALGAASSEMLMNALIRFVETENDKQQAREAILQGLGSTASGYSRAIATMASTLARLTPTKQDQQRTKEVLIRIICGWSTPLFKSLLGHNARDLVSALIQLDLTEQERQQVREALLGILMGEPSVFAVGELAGALVMLSAREQLQEDQRVGRQALLKALNSLAINSNADHRVMVNRTVSTLIQLNPTEQDKQVARKALLEILSHPSEPYINDIHYALDSLLQLIPTEEDLQRGRDALLRLLADESDASNANFLARAKSVGSARQPTISKAGGPGAITPPVELLAAVRQNSPVGVWLAAIPSLDVLSPIIQKDN